MESFNGKLRDELLNGEIFYTLAEAKIVIEQWRRYYNTIRPHSSLGYRPPAAEVTSWPASPGSLPVARPDIPPLVVTQPSTNIQSGPLTGGWSPAGGEQYIVLAELRDAISNTLRNFVDS